MAKADIQKFLQRILLLLFGLQAIFIPVAAAVEEQAQQKIPPEVVQWITIVTAPWPTYTFGVLFLVILMGILMGLLIYQALAKTKIFGEEFGGAQSSIQGGIAVILTLIVIKFLPFSYYLILIAMVVLAAAFFGIFTIIKGISSYAGAEDKWKNTFTGMGIGVVLIVVGYFLLQMLGEFQRLGVVTGAGALSTQWPGAIAWLAVIVGIIFMVVGFAYGVMGMGGGRTESPQQEAQEEAGEERSEAEEAAAEPAVQAAITGRTNRQQNEELFTRLLTELEQELTALG